ncbi:MAG: MmcQ/YjbR family DNA-binding protein [Micropepsaceae bacterium]
MISVAAFRKLALAQPDATEAPHFELASFRIGGKIFSTLSEKEQRAMVKLTPEQQEMMTAAEPKIFQRIPNAWGDKGATWMHLKHADAKTALSALKFAVANVASKKKRAKA